MNKKNKWQIIYMIIGIISGILGVCFITVKIKAAIDAIIEVEEKKLSMKSLPSDNEE